MISVTYETNGFPLQLQLLQQLPCKQLWQLLLQWALHFMFDAPFKESSLDIQDAIVNPDDVARGMHKGGNHGKEAAAIQVFRRHAPRKSQWGQACD